MIIVLPPIASATSAWGQPEGHLHGTLLIPERDSGRRLGAWPCSHALPVAAGPACRRPRWQWAEAWRTHPASSAGAEPAGGGLRPSAASARLAPLQQSRRRQASGTIRLVAAFFVDAAVWAKRQACSARGRAPSSSGRPASICASPGESTQNARTRDLPVTLSSARPPFQRRCVSSGTASATRPAQRAFAIMPKGAAITEAKSQEARVLTRRSRLVRAAGVPGRGRPGGGQQTAAPTGNHEASGVRNRLGNPQPFFPEGSALGERA